MVACLVPKRLTTRRFHAPSEARVREALHRRALHDEREAAELLLHGLEAAANGFDSGRGGPGIGARDAVASATKKGADELCGLPGVESGLPEVFAEVGKIGLGEALGGGLQGRPRLAGGYRVGSETPICESRIACHTYVFRCGTGLSMDCARHEGEASALPGRWRRGSMKA